MNHGPTKTFHNLWPTATARQCQRVSVWRTAQESDAKQKFSLNFVIIL